MSIYASPVEVVNAALSRLGKRPIQDFSDAAKPAVVANDIYEGVIGDLLAKHHWSFAVKRAELTHQGTTTGEYTEIFALPSDCLSVIRVAVGGLLVDYEVQDNKILTNTGSGLIAKYHYRAPEGKWPGDFAEGVVRMLQAHFSRALDENESAALEHEKVAEARLMRAMVRDKRQSPPKREQRINGGRLVSAWRGGL